MASTQKPTSLLEALEQMINIDADTLDTDAIRTLPVVPNDQTSNPFFLHQHLGHPSSTKTVAQIAQELKSEGFVAVYSRIAVAFCKQNINLIRGRVLVQTLPSLAYNTAATADHAQRYATEFRRAGIATDRYCIKIMATGPGVAAAKELAGRGIPVLGTGVFTVEQAVACSQAGCLFISPYYNEIRAHSDPALWPDVDDPAVDHPFSNRLVQMIQAYKDLHAKTGRTQPLIKNASFIAWREVAASAEIGCHSATVGPHLLQEWGKMPVGDLVPIIKTKVAKLANPYVASSDIPASRLRHLQESDPLASRNETSQPWKPCDLEVDYVSSGGKAITEVLARDTIAEQRLGDALEWFCQAEANSRALVDSLWTSKNKV